MTDQQILELAEKYLDVFPDDVTSTKKQLIEFALQVADIEYDRGFNDGWESREQAEYFNRSSYPTGLYGDPQ